jgi:hypothetical protein
MISAKSVSMSSKDAYRSFEPKWGCKISYSLTMFVCWPSTRRRMRNSLRVRFKCTLVWYMSCVVLN